LLKAKKKESFSYIISYTFRDVGVISYNSLPIWKI